MDRKEQVKQIAEKVIDNGKRPSAQLIAEKLQWSEADVHRCLNILEKEGKASTYRKEIMNGEKMRFVGLNR